MLMKTLTPEAREMDPWLRALTALAQDTGLIPSFHTGPLTTACNSGSRGADAFFWALLVHPDKQTSRPT